MKFGGGCVLSNRQVDAAVSVFRPSPDVSLIPLPLSLGCFAAAPGSAGGRCAAAKAGTTEEQHGQRSAGRGKCETSHYFRLTL